MYCEQTRRWRRRGGWLLALLWLAGCGGAGRPPRGEDGGAEPDGGGTDGTLDGGPDAVPPEEGGTVDGGLEVFAWVSAGDVEGRDLTGYLRGMQLDDGRVVFCYGAADQFGGFTAYDPATDEWTLSVSVPNVATLGCAHMTQLEDGLVVWGGGATEMGDGLEGNRYYFEPGGALGPSPDTGGLESLLYDPAIDTFSRGPTLQEMRGMEAGVAWPGPGGGLVLVGGVRGYLNPAPPPGVGESYRMYLSDPLASAERYDPASNRWVAIASMRQPRWGHGLVALPDGTLLAMGGYQDPIRDELYQGEPTATAERYDPASDRWTSVAPMPEGRAFFAAAVLPSGKVLVAGGFGPGQRIRSTSWLYDPGADRWEEAERMPQAAALSGMAVLEDGSVLLVGGIRGWRPRPGSAVHFVTTVQRYREGRGWSLGVPVPDPWLSPAVVALRDGRVLVAGGYGVGSTGWTRTSPGAVITDRSLLDD